MPGIPQIIFLIVLGGAFVHFIVMGARTFAPSTDDRGAALGQLSFTSGIVATWYLGFHVPIGVYRGAASAVLLFCSLVLYESARHVIWGRRFYLAWSGDVPDSLCDEGPYAWIRHPIYVSYILAFVAATVALPTVPMIVVCAINVALFTHAAYSDERSLASSALAPEYARYKEHTGMFFPRLKRTQ
jgi:protein-S-isoprenylcysteine O-methyltransferase Ste14